MFDVVYTASLSGKLCLISRSQCGGGLQPNGSRDTPLVSGENFAQAGQFIRERGLMLGVQPDVG